jgi:hypothetical protein
MSKTEKRYIITAVKFKVIKCEYHSTPLTLQQAIEYYSYTLEIGAAWQHEKGNKKINLNPKTISGLVNNLTKAESNAAKNGVGAYFTFKEFVDTKVIT